MTKGLFAHIWRVAVIGCGCALAFSCAQQSMRHDIHKSDTTQSVKAKLDEAVASVRWETSAFAERKTPGAKKASVNGKDFLAVYPSEKGIYPSYPGLGVLDYSQCESDVIATVEKVGSMLADGSWRNDDKLFFPGMAALRDYHESVQEEMPTNCSVLYGAPFFTDEDAFEVVYFFNPSNNESRTTTQNHDKKNEPLYLTVFYIHSKDGWYVDDFIQDSL